MDKKIQDILTRGVEQVIVKTHLQEMLSSGKKLRVKHGIDPTGQFLHLGHAATLWKLKELQDLGHKIVIIIGDFTAQIGDPSDKLAKRPFLTATEVRKNMQTYEKQLGLILDLPKVEFHYNSEWFSKLSLRRFDELAELFSIQQTLNRRNFQERLKKEEEISLRELHYPLYQGYDSVMIRADIEIGGNDQLFNLLAGRKIQQAEGQRPQDIIATAMLLGLDGEKMSKTQGNIINLLDQPEDMYGKIMSMRDELTADYFLLCARRPEVEVNEIKKALKEGANPRDLKMKLALEVVSLYHGQAKAKKAEEQFVQVFQKKETPKEVESLKLSARGGSAFGGKSLNIVDLLVKTKLASSKSEARRLVEQGGIKIDGNAVKRLEAKLTIPKQGLIIQKGKRHFLRIINIE